MEEQALILAKLLGMVGFQVNPQQAELIINLNDLAKEKGNKVEIADVDSIVEKWSKKMNKNSSVKAGDVIG